MLIAFGIALFVRESPLFSFLFWIPFEAIRRMAPGVKALAPAPAQPMAAGAAPQQSAS